MNRMKKLIVIFCVLNALIGYSQQKDFNLIIAVDNDLRNVYVDKFIIKDKEGKSEIVRASYVPGNLSVETNDYKKLTSESVTNITLIVRYIKHCEDNILSFNYDIEDFKLPWLNKGTHFILYIYDTTNKKYKEIYDSLPEKKFTFEYDWSEGSMRRVQKKLMKKQKDCNK